MILPRTAAQLAPLDQPLPIEVRSPKGGGGGGGRGGGGGSSSGSGSSTKSSSGAVVVGGGGNGAPWPVWKIVVVVLVTTWLFVFMCALAYYYKKAEKKGGKTEHGKIWWKAFCISTFLWIPILLYKKFVSKKRHTAKGLIGGDVAGSYSKIEGGAAHNIGADNSAAAPYGEGGTGYRPNKYEPYATIAPSPMGSPNLDHAQSAFPPPPPYVSGATGGEAQDYYSGHPLHTRDGASSPPPGPSSAPAPSVQRP